VSRFWRIDDNQAVLDGKKNSKTFLEEVFNEILRRFFRAELKPRQQTEKSLNKGVKFFLEIGNIGYQKLLCRFRKY
jgi:hypothetical protein